MGSTRKRAPAEPRDDPRARLRAFIAARIQPGARLCVAYSGGLDSSVLLHGLVSLREEMGYSLFAVHVHHGLAAEADAWAEHCRVHCAAWGVPLRVERVRVECDGHGVEAAARTARHAVYARQDADYVVLGQHLDDQVETGLLRLLRGSGAHGLAGMAAERILAGATSPVLLRPFLDCPRAALRAYAELHGLDWVEDASNADLTFTRNWLRHDILPRLEARFPAVRRNVARAMAHLENSAALLDDLAAIDLAALAPEGIAHGIELSGLTELTAARRHNLLRHVIRHTTGLPPEQAALLELERQMLTTPAHATPVWRGHGLEAFRHRGRLFLLPATPRLASPPDWAWRGEDRLDLGAAGCLRFQRVYGAGLAVSALPAWPLHFGVRRGGERMRLDADGPERALKTILYEAGFPAWWRDRLPLLRIGEATAWVAGVGVDARYRARPGEPGWLIYWNWSRSFPGFPSGAIRPELALPRPG